MSDNGTDRGSADILLVDDRYENLLALKATLEELGQNLVLARSGQEALKHLLHTDFAAIVLDVNMPEMDGFETASLIRQRPRSRHTPIIFLTAVDTAQSQVYRGYSVGAVDYILKPFEPDILKSKVAVFIRLYEVTRELEKRLDETSRLNQQLDVINQELRRSKEALQEAHEELESRVVERTAQLMQANEALQTEIVERQRIEDQLRASLREKDLLLKEIHHRVKNNLQVVSSMLRLQSSHVPDPRSLALFEESQMRVRSMALIHEKLYQSHDLGKVDFGEYLRSLGSSLMHLFGADPKRIRLLIDVHDVFLGIDTAIPCGLIVNELVSNCLKHAFPPASQGEIAIALRADGNHHWALTVRDTGVGIPGDLDPRKSKSLGLQLVHTLTEQLNGTLVFHVDHGTTFDIHFSELEYRKRI